MKASTLSQKPKPKPKPTPTPTPTSLSSRHVKLYKVCLQGLLSGAELQKINPADGMRFQMDGQEELRLLKHLTFLAWNAATYAAEICRDEDAEEFAKQV